MDPGENRGYALGVLWRVHANALVLGADHGDLPAHPQGAELLELLVEQSRIVDQLQKEVGELREEAARRRIGLEKAGSIAEASLQLTKIFEDAEEASKIYIENIEARSAEQDRKIPASITSTFCGSAAETRFWQPENA